MRENDSGGGCICCSGGMGEYAKRDPSFDHVRGHAEECGKLHRDLTERIRDEGVEVIQIEPKDYLFVIPTVVRGILRHRRPLIPAIKTLMLWHAVPAVIVNGKTVGAGRVPTVEDVLKELGLKPRVHDP